MIEEHYNNSSYHGRYPNPSSHPSFLPHLSVDNIGRNNQNLLSAIPSQLRKDVQLYQDNTEYSQLIQQMIIPLSPDSSLILVQDWLRILELEFNVPLSQAQYVNIWDPISKNYFNIAKLYHFSAGNVLLSSPIYIRYAPNDQIFSQTLNNQTIFNNKNTNQSSSIFLNLAKGNQQYQQFYQQQQQQQQEEQTQLLPVIKHENLSPQFNPVEKKQSTKGRDTPILSSIKMEEGTGIIQSVHKHDGEDSSDQDLEKFKQKGLKKKESDKSKHHSSKHSPSKKHIPREKRVKERQISYVKSKVDEWRSLYENGKTNFVGQTEKLNLDVAAQLVGLSRKTLDDYYAQLRKAEKYGFDFEHNGSEKMGALRHFVKKMSDNNQNDDESSEENEGQKTITFNTPQLKSAIAQDSEEQDQQIVGRKNVFRKYSENKYDILRHISSSSASTATATPSPGNFGLNQSNNNTTNNLFSSNTSAAMNVKNNSQNSQIFSLSSPSKQFQPFLLNPVQQSTHQPIPQSVMLPLNSNASISTAYNSFQNILDSNGSIFTNEILSSTNQGLIRSSTETNHLPIFNAMHSGVGGLEKHRPHQQQMQVNFAEHGVNMEAEESFDYLNLEKHQEEADQEQ